MAVSQGKTFTFATWMLHVRTLLPNSDIFLLSCPKVDIRRSSSSGSSHDPSPFFHPWPWSQTEIPEETTATSLEHEVHIPHILSDLDKQHSSFGKRQSFTISPWPLSLSLSLLLQIQIQHPSKPGSNLQHSRFLAYVKSVFGIVLANIYTQCIQDTFTT